MFEDEYGNVANRGRNDTDDNSVEAQNIDSDRNRPLSDSEGHQTREDRQIDEPQSLWSKFHDTEEQ
jgi:hypothetical protein